MAALVRGGPGESQFCGGSLIADGSWVLTAAHCVQWTSPENFG